MTAVPETTAAPRISAPRLVYLDVLRGLAVLIMVLAHVVDSWTREADRHDLFFYTVFVGGLGAPLFLFLAGVAQAMSANARAARTGDRRAGARAIWRRGWEVFVLAFVFRLQSQMLGWGPLRNLLKVDILNVMGLSMVLTALLWSLSAARARRIAMFAAATLLAAFITPLARMSTWLAVLPDPMEAYLRPLGSYTAFSMLPWASFVFAGAIVGELVDATRDTGGSPSRASLTTPESSDLRLQVPLGIAGVAGVLLGWWASFQPSIYTRSDFWTSSPTFFFIRLGLVTSMVPAAWAHCEFWLRENAHGPATLLWRAGEGITRALELLGRSSLFVYWIHVEMVYGVVATPIKRELPLWASLLGTLALCVLLFGVTRLKNRWMEGVELPAKLRIFAAVLR